MVKITMCIFLKKKKRIIDTRVKLNHKGFNFDNRLIFRLFSEIDYWHQVTRKKEEK